MKSVKAAFTGADSCERVSADRALREAGEGMSAHHCHACFELFYVEQGACRFLVDENACELRRGDFILIPPQVFHYAAYSQRCTRCNLYFRAEDIGAAAMAALPEGRDFFSSCRIFRAREGAGAPLEALLSRMVAEERVGDGRTEALQYHALQALFLLVSRLCRVTRSVPAKHSGADDQALMAARFISRNYMHPITSADIAAAVGFSPNHLSRKFRETTGMGVHEYLVSTRLQHAAMELLSTTDTVTQVAIRCGFSDSNYFKDVFKRRYGVTPRDYRKGR